MTACLLASFLVGGACCIHAQTEVKVWSRLIGGSNYDYGHGVAVDPLGNVAIGGPTQSSLGGQSAGLFDVFVGKYDASGNKLWLAQRGSSETEYGFDDLHGGVACDATGNVYVVGRTKGGVDGYSNIGGYDLFVMKFGPNGDWQWTRQDGTANDDTARAVVTDSSGNVYVTGYVRGNFHGNTRVGAADVFINKYNSAGTRLWTVLFGSENVDESFGITCDTAGNVIVTGWCDGSIDGIPNLGNGDNFLAKYDSNGQRLWLQQWGTVHKDTGYALATDAARNIYLSGYTTGPLYGSQAGNRDVFLAKFNAAGTNLWGIQMGTSEHDQAWGVAADAAGDVYLAGETGGMLGSDPWAGDLDVFVAKYSPTGSQIWLKQLGTTNVDFARAIAVSTNGSIFVAGRSSGHFDGNTNHGLYDAILIKYASSNSPPPAPTATAATGVTPTTFTANWYAANWTAGYRLDVSTNSAFSSYVAGYQNLDVGNVLSRDVSGLSPGTAYYYRVRAYGSTGTSGNSATVTVSTPVPTCTPAMLLNGSFEGTSSGGIGANWVGYQRPPNPTTVWSIQTASPPTTTSYRYQRIANTSSTGGGGVRQTITGCTIGASYIVSGWMRCNSASATCTVKVSPNGSTDWNTAIHLDPPQTYSGSTWVPFSGTVMAQAPNMTIWLDGQTGGTGLNKAADFDAVTVSCPVVPMPLHFDSLTWLPQDQVQMILSGTAGSTVTVHRSSDLGSWVTLTNLINSNGTFQVIDPTADSASRRYYRATSP